MGHAITQAMSSETASKVAAMLKAISDPLRLRILSAITADPRSEVCVCDLLDLADVSQPTVSHHLRVMKDAGLLTSERRGTWVYYRIAPNRHNALTALLEGFAFSASFEEHAGEKKNFATLAENSQHVENLAVELADEIALLDEDLVTAIVRDSYTGLMRTRKQAERLLPLTESFARQRLLDLTRDRQASVPQVLFVCVANAGRSQMAATLMNQLAQGSVIARSAGSVPAAKVHPHVRSALAEITGDENIWEAFPKPLTDDAVRAADVVITMGCGDVCPIIPGVHYEDWAIGDPALASEEGVKAIREDIEDRVRDLLVRLSGNARKGTTIP